MHLRKVVASSPGAIQAQPTLSQSYQKGPAWAFFVVKKRTEATKNRFGCSRRPGCADCDDSSPQTREAAEDLTISGNAIMIEHVQQSRLGPVAALLSTAALLLFGLAPLPTASAQSVVTPPEAIATPGGEAARTLPLMQIEPTQRQADDSFIRSLSANDAFFEVIIGQGRMLTLERDMVEPGQPSPLIATGDPSVIDFEIVGPRHIRITGQRLGVTDLSIVPSVGEAMHLEVHVVADLTFLRARLRQTFPDALLEVSHLREHLVVEGQARDSRQISQIIQLIGLYLESVQVARRAQGTSGAGGARGAGGPPAAGDALGAVLPDAAVPEAVPGEELPPPVPDDLDPLLRAPGDIGPDVSRPSIRVELPRPQIINLIRLPGPQQVLLKVQVAELNRTALRQLGVDFLFQNNGNAFGSNIGGGLPPGVEGGGLLGLLDPLTTDATAFGVFDGGNVNFFVDALRRNQVFKVLAEPTLVALHGQEASFLSGGEFPVPVPQGGAATGAVTIEYREFGVGLTFVPYILDDDTVRLAVAPEVSSIDFSLGITVGGIQVPALNTRRTRTVVELQQGQTLAVSGLLQVEMEAGTDRIPGLGDLPHIGALFRNNTSRRVEKELIILVTPHLVGALNADEVPPPPGADVCEPTDKEFFLQGRIEGRTGQPFRSTTRWDDPFGWEQRRQLESEYLIGPYGYSH